MIARSATAHGKTNTVLAHMAVDKHMVQLTAMLHYRHKLVV